MKKLAIALTIASLPVLAVASSSSSTTTTTVPSKRYTGLYVNFGLGLGGASSHSEIDVSDVTTVNEVGSTHIGWLGQADMGYRFALSKYFVTGFDIVGNLTNTDYTNNLSVYGTSGTTTVGLNVEHKYDYGLLGELGVVIHQNLFSVITGPIYTKIQTTSTLSEPGEAESRHVFKQKTHGWLFGFNAVQPLAKHLAFFERATYTVMEDSTLNVNSLTIQTIKGTYIRATSGMIGLQFTF